MINYLKKTSIFLGVGIIIIVSAWMLFSSRVDQSVPQEEIRIPQEEAKQEVVLVIDAGEGLPDTFEIEPEEGMTAFSLLRNKTEELSLPLKTKTYDNIGIFIEAIGDKENGQDGKYWLYYVNEEMPVVAADKQEIKAGDRVEFKFEKSPF